MLQVDWFGLLGEERFLGLYERGALEHALSITKSQLRHNS